MRKPIWRHLSVLLLVVAPAGVFADTVSCGWPGAHQVDVKGGWIDVVSGRDEDLQHLRLAIWGSERVQVRCENLDEDEEAEIVVISRGIGSGPYYRLQVIDPRKGGLSTWAASSQGQPRIENGNILLGTLPNGYQGAASKPAYASYRLTAHGIIPEADDAASQPPATE